MQSSEHSCCTVLPRLQAWHSLGAQLMPMGEACRSSAPYVHSECQHLPTRYCQSVRDIRLGYRMPSDSRLSNAIIEFGFRPVSPNSESSTYSDPPHPSLCPGLAFCSCWNNVQLCSLQTLSDVPNPFHAQALSSPNPHPWKLFSDSATTAASSLS